ncbi:MAG: glcD [Cryptosporangiaceae bacterium]|jgi:glycolate oxidase|nr:glcD [Cryptosporangiaceae bacterium]
MTQTRSAADDLVRLLGPDRVFQDEATREAYARDATPLFHRRPDVVVTPASTAEVAEVVRYAAETGTPIVPRGAGSSLCAGAVALAGGISLVLTKMDAILEVSRPELLAVVQPGVTTIALDEAAGAQGLMFAPDPGSRTVSTIGGNIATCAGGLRGLKYGVTRNYVLGLEAVLGTGEVIRTGGRLVKDVAGYDLTRLFTGSEGTLAVITEATVGLLPRPAAAGYGLAYFGDLAGASTAVDAIVGAGILPATLEFLDNTCIRAVEDFAVLGLDVTAGALLLFGDDGDPATVERTVARMAEVCSSVPSCREVTLAADVAAADALLAARRCSLPALARLGTLTLLEDVSVPRPRMPEAVARIADIAARHGITMGTFGHAGDGNLHPTAVVDADDPAAVEAAHSAFAEVFRLAIDLGGTISGEHGIGAAKLPYLGARLGETHLGVLRRVKAAFDPAGILNPGKLGS